MTSATSPTLCSPNLPLSLFLYTLVIEQLLLPKPESTNLCATSALHCPGYLASATFFSMYQLLKVGKHCP